MKNFRSLKNFFSKNRSYFLAFLPLIIAFIIIISAFFRYKSISKSASLPVDISLSLSETALEKVEKTYPECFTTLHDLPYKTIVPDLHIRSFSAILINADTGAILYEKNPDAVIPPASMTKLFLIYSVMKHIESGEYSLSTIIPIDERSYASSMPPHSSLMFLGKGQKATLLELLKGLSVSSGNDASYAIAYGIFGSMENFLSEINEDIKNLGLTHTKIVESSGYSEENLTTAREMAAFSRIYIEKYPELLSLLHSVPENTYPESHNLPKEMQNLPPQSFSKGIPQAIWTPITQKNTNPLLGVLQGCDGIKTGHINESGYNLCLTTTRNGARYISVTMGGPGNDIKSGDLYRAEDGKALHEYAYSNFFILPEPDLDAVRIASFGGNRKSITLVPVTKNPVILPYVLKDSPLEYSVTFTRYPFGKTDAGDTFGNLTISCNGQTYLQVPLVSAENTKPSSKLLQSLDNILMKIYMKNHK